VTIAEDRNGYAKGYAFLEFTEIESISAALQQDGQILKKRKIKVIPKRTNIPGKGKSRGRSSFMYNNEVLQQRQYMANFMFMPKPFTCAPRRRARQLFPNLDIITLYNRKNGHCQCCVNCFRSRIQLCLKVSFRHSSYRASSTHCHFSQGSKGAS
jgi:RNA recognition motif-containing protein